MDKFYRKYDCQNQEKQKQCCRRYKNNHCIFRYKFAQLRNYAALTVFLFRLLFRSLKILICSVFCIVLIERFFTCPCIQCINNIISGIGRIRPCREVFFLNCHVHFLITARKFCRLRCINNDQRCCIRYCNLCERSKCCILCIKQEKFSFSSLIH